MDIFENRVRYPEINYPPILKIFRKEKDGVNRKIKLQDTQKERTVVDNPPKEIILTDKCCQKPGNERNEKKRKERARTRTEEQKSKFV
jgi:hypothetical protein